MPRPPTGARSLGKSGEDHIIIIITSIIDPNYTAMGNTPFVLATVNAADVAGWIHALQQASDDDDRICAYRYREALVYSVCKKAFTLYAGLEMLGVGLFNPVSRYLLEPLFLPKPLQGATMERMICVRGQGIGANGNRAQTIFYVPRDAGYLDTAQFWWNWACACSWIERGWPRRWAWDSGHVPRPWRSLLKRLQDTGTEFTSRVYRVEK